MNNKINYNKNKKIMIGIISFIVLFTCVFYVKGILYESNRNLEFNEDFFSIDEKTKTELKKLINIDTLPDEFMDNYFENVSNLTNEDHDNLLIVISKERVKNTYGAYKVIDAPNNNYYLVYENGKARDNAYKKLKKNSDILSVEKNPTFYVASESELDSVSDENSSYTPWGIEKLGYDNAIEAVESMDNPNDIVVAVIDTGINVENFKNKYGDRLDGTYDVIKESINEEDMYDAHSHGTHVAGIVADATPDNVEIYAINAEDKNDDGSNSGTNSFDGVNLDAAINYAIKMDVDVINFSIGKLVSKSNLEDDKSVEGYKSMYQAIQSTINRVNDKDEKLKDIIFVACAGNENSSSFYSPGDFDALLSVTAVDSHFERASFSNYGKYKDFAAPGYKIEALSNETGTKIKSGTSQASPHVAAAVAILKSFNKNLTFDQIKELLKKHAIDIGDDGFDEKYGYGVVNFNGVEFCNDDVGCDEYGVFKKNNIETFKTIKIEPTLDEYIPKYNYGTITNIISSEVKLYYTENDYYVKTLAQIFDNIKIIGYDPNNYNKQNVTIEYIKDENGLITKLETILIIDNSQMLNGWEFNELTDNTIELTKINYDYITCTDNLRVCDDGYNYDYAFVDIPPIIYIPNEINGKKVVNLVGGLFEVSDSSTQKIPLTRIYIPDGVEKTGKNAFNSTFQKNFDTGPLEIYFPNSVTSIAGTNSINSINKYNFAKNRNKLAIFSNKNSFAYNFGEVFNKIKSGFDYFYLEKIDIEKQKDNFQVSDKIDVNDLKIEATYIGNNKSAICYEEEYSNEEERNTIIVKECEQSNIIKEKIKNFEIKYQNGDSLSLGDTSFIVSFDTKYGFHVEEEVNNIQVSSNVKKPTPVSKQYVYNGTSQEFELDGFDERVMSVSNNYRTEAGEQEVVIKLTAPNYLWEDDGTNNDIKLVFKIDKAKPSYKIPTGLNGRLNQKLSDVKFPEDSGFEWMDGSQVLNELGQKEFKAKYTPKDTKNYIIVENINVEVFISGEIITPIIEIEDKIYDGTKNIDYNTIKVTNLEKDDYTIESAELTSVNVGNAKAIIRIKLSNNNYEFEGGVQEKEFEVDVRIDYKKISKPSPVNEKYTYNGQQQEFKLVGFDEKIMSISNNYRTEAGEQNVVVKLKDSTNYLWKNDGTNDDVIFPFKIEKADLDIDYEALDNKIKYDGNSHGIILKIEDNNVKVKYMDEDGKYTLDKMPLYKEVGSYGIKYKLYINNNYTEIEGEKTLTIEKMVISNNTLDKEVIYDGNEYFVNIDLNVNNYNIKYSIDNKDYNLKENPKFKDVGEYTVNYKVTCDNCEDLVGSNKVKIYGIKNIHDSIKVKNNILLLKNNNYSNLINNINIYSLSKTINHLNNKKNVINTDSVKTGEYLRITINNSKKIEYELAFMGDISGDGAINSADLLKVRQHLLGSVKLSGAYFIASDINYDNTINSADLLRVRQHLLGTKPIM